MKHTKDKEIADGFTQPRFGGRIAMSETERQFKSIGWTQNPGDWNKWTHRLHGSQYFDPKLTDELMDMWITGFVAGKETFGTDTIDNLTAERDELREIVEDHPQTIDGEICSLGFRLYHPALGWVQLESIQPSIDGEMQWNYADCKGGLTTPEWCYSSQRAAERARWEG